MGHALRTALAAAVALAASAQAMAADNVYAPPAPAKLKATALKWVADQKVDAAVQKQVDKIWSDVGAGLSPRVGFQKVIETFAVVRPDAMRFIESCTLVDAPLTAPKAEFLKNAKGEFYGSNLRLYYGRYLAQRKMYDESLAVLSELNPRSVADPATCLFFKAVCEHQLLKKKDGLATLATLLKSTEQVPVSYSNVATLMEFELKGIRNGVSLTKVSLKMRDSERRLDLARGGQRVQKLQNEIIADLDELIEKLEQQQGGGECACQNPGQGKTNKPSSPAPDSRILGTKGDGKVDVKNLTRDRTGWGKLPPAKIAAAKNALNRTLPPHYQRAIEAYTKRIAGREAKK